jgi:hypothetical protein|tara:strand:+ start:196 stop:321 length:126 start_codon:yes stop_codon:yes gene_type:complete
MSLGNAIADNAADNTTTSTNDQYQRSRDKLRCHTVLFQPTT